MDAIGELRERIDRFDPAVYGWEWAPQDAPCIQPELQGWRGYIEARPVRRKQGLSGARPAQEKG